MRFLRDPLTHFLLIGALLFAVYGAMNPQETQSSEQIVVTEGKIQNLAATFVRTWHRPPSEKELNDLIQEYLREEVAAREAKALGLDRDDTVIRRRLRQKLEFISDDLAAQAQPTLENLRAFFDAHRQDFQQEPRITFKHVFLNPQQRGERLAVDSVKLLADLEKSEVDTEVALWGDGFLLGHQFSLVSPSQIASQFGQEFAGKLEKQPVGKWAGPVPSSYGIHFVYIEHSEPAPEIQFDEVKDRVRQKWLVAHREEATQRFYEEMLKRYSIRIEKIDPDKVAGGSSS